MTLLLAGLFEDVRKLMHVIWMSKCCDEQDTFLFHLSMEETWPQLLLNLWYAELALNLNDSFVAFVQVILLFWLKWTTEY